MPAALLSLANGCPVMQQVLQEGGTQAPTKPKGRPRKQDEAGDDQFIAVTGDQLRGTP